MQTEEYAGVDEYLKGYRAAIDGAFCPETGWFWSVLSQAHDKVSHPWPSDKVDEFYDTLVDAVNQELGR